MVLPNEILKEAFALHPEQQAELAGQLLANLDQNNKGNDRLWAEETENRIDVLDRGDIQTVSLEQVLRKYAQINYRLLLIFLSLFAI